MQEDVTLVQAARLIGITPRILTAWLHDAGIITRTGKDKRAHYLTLAQVRMLAAAHGRVLPDDTSLAALAGQVQALSAELDALKRRVAALEQPKIRAARGFPESLTQSLREPSPGALLPQLRAAFAKMDMARLIAARHGVDVGTAKGWPWPTEALASQDAALRWALEYVAERPPHKRPHGWRWRCDVPDCPCHQRQDS